MPRPKKDGKHINLYLDRLIVEELEEYAVQKRQTVTAALESLLNEAFNKNKDKSLSKQKSAKKDGNA